MPEQYQRIREYVEEQNKIDIPSLSEDQIAIIDHHLTQKFINHDLAMISYWRNGYIHMITAYIQRIDSLNQSIIISNEDGRQTMELKFKVICNVE